MNIDLDAIEKHRAFLERAHRMSCSDPDDPKRSTTYGESAKAIAFLLAYARDLEARIGRVREMHQQHVEFMECVNCCGDWPCPTSTALSEATGGAR